MVNNNKKKALCVIKCYFMAFYCCTDDTKAKANEARFVDILLVLLNTIANGGDESPFSYTCILISELTEKNGKQTTLRVLLRSCHVTAILSCQQG